MARRSRRQPPSQPIEWHFRSFPVFFAFCLGAFLATMLLWTSGFLLFLPIWVGSMFGVSYGLAHITGHWVRRRAAEKAQTRVAEDDRERRALSARSAAAAREAEAPPAAERRRRRRRG